MDERKESGEFYPGGRAPQGGGGSGGEGGDTAPKVPVTHVDELPERYREGDVRIKINQLARIISGGVAALAAMVATAQVTVQGARKDALYNDDFVVTNVTVDLGHVATTNQLMEAAGAVAEAAEGKLAAATNDLAGTMGGVIVSATNSLAGVVSRDIAAATNAAAADRDAKLEGYATKTWVQGRGYADGSALEGYATQGWVAEQGYAPRSWVEGRGYMTGTNLAPYATKEWVEGRGYATGTNLADATEGVKGWVQGQGYATRTEVENVQAVIGPTVRAEVGEAVRDIVYERDVAQRVEAMEDAPAQTNGWRMGTWIDGAKEYWSVNGIWDGTNLVGLVTNVTGLALIEDVDYAVADALETATNYTQVVAEGLSNLSNALETGAMQVWNAWSSQDSQHAYYADISGALSDGTSQRAGAQIFAQLDAASHITTNDVCAIVTNEIPIGDWKWAETNSVGWIYAQSSAWIQANGNPDNIYFTVIQQPIYMVEEYWDAVVIGWSWQQQEIGYGWDTTFEFDIRNENEPEDATELTLVTSEGGEVKFYVLRKSSNALGLARMTDIPSTNGFVTASITNEVGSLISNTVTKAYVEDLGIIATNNPDFVAAVTNCPVAIAAGDAEALTQWGIYGGGGTIGALLAALAAAVAALRRDKAEKSELRYAMVTPILSLATTDDADDTAAVQLQDRAMNQVTLGAGIAYATLTFPAKETGKARDFFVRLTITGSDVPTLYFKEQGGASVAFDVDDDSWAEIEQGVNVLMFSDTSEASA